MFDLMLKLAKKKFLKADEDPVREYMRLELELEEICSLHAISMSELKQMNQIEVQSSFDTEEIEPVESRLFRMRQLWPVLPQSERQYLSSPERNSVRRDLVEFDELAEDFKEKEYLSLYKDLEQLAQAQYIGVRGLVQMTSTELVSLFGRDEATEIHSKRLRMEELWTGFSPQQRDRYILQRV